MSENQPSDYAGSPEEQHARWGREFAAARKALQGWQKTGGDIDAEFRNELASGVAEGGVFDSRIALFSSDIITIIAMLYGQVPRSTVSRRFGDSDDDLGRIAGEILERTLNTDISRGTDTYAAVLRYVLMDFFLPGFAQARARYETGEIVSEDVAAEVDPVSGRELVAAYTKETRPKEDVHFDYIHWRDWLWGPAKVLHDVPWWAHKALMSREQLVKRFGETGKAIPLKKDDQGNEDPWSRAEVWEVYEKATKKVRWYCETSTKILDEKDDPLRLEGFYPFPVEPLVANLTTSKVVPRPYYALHQDQYKQINSLKSRINEIVDAIRVSGVCDKAVWEHIQRLLSTEGRGKLHPVPDWQKISGNGGVDGMISWLPLEQMVKAIGVLQQQLINEIDLLHQATGFSDIMRGEATQAGATATEQKAKVKFGSVRVQRLQDEIARYATDLLKIKAEIIAKHFAPETIYERANVRFMPKEDQAKAWDAIDLLKSDIACYRIEVKPEAVALADFAAMKAERSELLTVLTTFFQAMAPIAQSMQGSLPHLLKIAQWTVAGVRGSSQIEGVFDQMIAAAEQAAAQAAANPQQPPSNPQLEVENAKQQTVQMKAGLDMQKDVKKAELAQQTKMVEVQADAMREENQRHSNVQEFAQRSQISAMTKAMNPTKPGGVT